MSEAISGTGGSGVGTRVPHASAEPDPVAPAIAARGLRLAGPPPPEPAAPRRAIAVDAGPLRRDQLPVLVLTGAGVEERAAYLPRAAGLEQQEIQHEVAGTVRRSQTIIGVRLALSDAGLDRVAGLVALGADHSHGCLGARGLSLGDATRYAARLERLGLRAENSWRGLAEGYYVLDAEPWNLRRLLDVHVIWRAEELLRAVPRTEAPADRHLALVLLGPTCMTAAS